MSIIDVLLRIALSIFIGGLIGTERARHGRAAGMRTHILVCLGSALASMTGIYVAETFGSGDVFRISAQVVSGVGFLGAGMIILKNGNVITGLTTAAGVWATATIGIALGYGFYSGAVIVAVFFLIAVILLAKLERSKRSIEVVYIESDNMNNLNALLDALKAKINTEYSVNILAPKSNKQGNIGIYLIFEKRYKMDYSSILELPDVVYAIEEQ